MSIFDTSSFAALGRYTFSTPEQTNSNSTNQNSATAEKGSETQNDSVSFSAEGLAAYQKIEGQPVYYQKASFTLKRPEPVEPQTLAMSYHTTFGQTPSHSAVNEVFGTHYTEELVNITRSDKMKAQAMAELSERTINEQISNLLEKSGLTLDKNERLDFSVNSFGELKVSEESGIAADKLKRIETVLNGNSSLKEELMLYQARRDFMNESTWNFATPDPTNGNSYNNMAISTIVYNAFDAPYRELSSEPTQTDNEPSFVFNFSYAQGKIFQSEEVPEDRLFNGRIDSLGTISILVGLDEPVENLDDFIEQLTELVDNESEALQKDFNSFLQQAGLGDVNKKITFATNAQGEIIVEGNIRPDQKKTLSQLINSDEEFADRVKSQKARMEILDEVRQSVEDEPANSKEGEKDAKNDLDVSHLLRPVGFDLARPELEQARMHLIDMFLKENGVQLDQLDSKYDQENDLQTLTLRDQDGNEKDSSALQALLSEMTGLEGELQHYLTQSKEAQTASTDSLASAKDANLAQASDPAEPVWHLFAMKRGELSETNGEAPPDFDDQVQHVRQTVSALMTTYNEEIAQDDSMKIVDYTVSLDEKGRATIQVKIQGDDPVAALEAEQYMNKLFDSSSTEELGLAILAQHDDEHGDVEEYKHNVLIEKDAFSDYQIRSQEADAAAMDEMNILSAELGAKLNDFFGTTFAFDTPFEIIWNGDSLSSVGLNGSMAGSVDQILQNINERLSSDDPYNDSLFENEISAELKEVVGLFFELKDARDKIHDPLLKEVNVRFQIEP